MEAYIYTYVNKITKKTYIGSRSNYNGSCYDDFNVKYFSSSKDKEFRKDMSNGLLEGQIVLVIDRPDSKTKIVELEHKMIAAYWKQYGKEKSYNHYCNGKFSVAGTHYCLSEETKKKMSTAKKGKKLGIDISGENNPMFGKHHSDESRQKMSEAKKGKPGTWIGRHHTEKTKQKITESKKGKLSPRKGTHLSEEIKKKISDAKKGKYVGEKNPMFGKTHSDNARKKISEVHKGKSKPKLKWLTPEGNIFEMSINSVKLHHKDWVLVENNNN